MEIADKSVRPKYNDLLIRIVVAVIAAHFIVTFGEDKTFFEFLLLADYYKSVLGSAVIAILLFSFVRYVTVRLDRQYEWNKFPLNRALLQGLFGLLLTAVLAFLLAAVYFRIYGINILTTVYLKYDFPVIALFVFILNIYYFTYYLLVQVKAGHQKSDKSQPAGNYTSVLIVNKGTENLPVNTTQISAFYHEGNYNFLKLFDGNSYLISQTLDDLEKQLDPYLFFRVSRQAIVGRNACKSFRILDYGKLDVTTEPPMKEPLVVSQKRSTTFKKWLELKAA